ENTNGRGERRMISPHALRTIVLVLATGLAALAGAGGRVGSPPAQAQGGDAIASLYTEAGGGGGAVAFTPEAGRGRGPGRGPRGPTRPAGSTALHVHTTAVWHPTAPSGSAGGHLDLGMGDLPGGGMAGDMTNLYVTADGTGAISFHDDRVGVSDLLADGGRAV